MKTLGTRLLRVTNTSADTFRIFLRDKEDCFKYLPLVNLIITYFLNICFGLNSPKGTAKTSAVPVDLLGPNILRSSKPSFSTPEKYDDHPCFYIRVHPSPGINVKLGRDKLWRKKRVNSFFSTFYVRFFLRGAGWGLWLSETERSKCISRQRRQKYFVKLSEFLF